MGFFSEFFRQFLPRRARNNSLKSPQSLNDTNNRDSTNSRSKSVSSGNNFITTNKSAKPGFTNAFISEPQHSSKYAKTFKHNEEGRRYHGIEEVAYLLPNDDDETDRLHQQHWILRYVLQCNFHAPVTQMLEEGITVLDAGCGPATWTFEMGEAFPESKFHGVDISCVFPEDIKPANVELVIGNIAKYIPYPDNTFDYVHQRLLFAGLTDENWESALSEIYRVLKPGGYVELAEADFFNFLNKGPLWTKLQDATKSVFTSLGISTKACGELENHLVKAGFVNQVIDIIPLALNHDGKRGELLWADVRHAFLNIRPGMAKIHSDWEDIQTYRTYVEACGVEAKKNNVSVNWYACYAQKPIN